MMRALKMHSGTMISIVRNKRYRTGFFWAAPFLAGLTVFLVQPFLELTVSTFFKSGRGSFAGLENYRKLLTSEAFRRAAGNTAALLAVSLLLICVTGVLLALFFQALREKALLLMAAGLIPFLVPALGAVLVVREVCPDSLWGLCVIHLWKYGGFYGVLLAFAIRQIPAEYYEAAQLEGAGYWRQVRLITLPCIREMLDFAVILGVVHTFMSYREALLLWGSYPPENLYLLQHYLSNNFEQMNQLHLSTAAVVITAATLLAVLAVEKGRAWKRRNAGRV